MYCVLVDALDKMEKVTNFDLTVTDFDIAFYMLEVIKVASEPASRSTLTSNIFEPLLISTGITWRNLILSIFWFCWLKVLLMLASCCVSSWCSTVWCFLPQILALHFHLHIRSFMTCVLHSLCFVEKSILSFTDIFLNWVQSIKRCLSSQSQHVSFSLLSSGFDGSDFLSLLFYWDLRKLGNIRKVSKFHEMIT